MDSPPAAGAVDASVNTDVSILKQSIEHLDIVISSFESLAADAPWSELGYLDAAQHDDIEHLFFRFLVSRRVLVSLALHENTATSRIRGVAATEAESTHIRSGDDDGDGALRHALARAESSFADEEMSDTVHSLRTMVILASAVALFVYEGKLVKCFRPDKIAIAKLNENFYQSDIPSDTYNMLRLECTDGAVDGWIRSLASAYHLFYSKDSTFHSIKDERADELTNLIDSLIKEADWLVQELVGIVLPSLKNRIEHAPLGDIARHARNGTKHILRETRARTFKGVSRLKSPLANLIKFSSQQKKDVLERIQPGDMIFTYTAGYMSDVFIPGAFKHGITFVGSPDDRDKAGLNADSIARIWNDLPEGEGQTLLGQFKVSTLPSSSKKHETLMEADIIEAVAEGVIFNNLCHIMDSHVNRLLVLRPKITSEERTDALVSIFRYLGDKYDFGFNFGDASAVVCTEIQYHAFNGKGQLSFKLTRRAGNPTLSADDIVNYYLASPDSLDFVLLAMEDEGSPRHGAKIYLGDDGIKMLTDLMTSESK